ncbi:MAG: hypothetical protein J0H29_13975 [Sphingobacteriales bacterium]|nr:hypothetical protein [Sphingobacteriales bacterium]OJY84378.1 MAG: hypothetical protein BGP14_19215 [Sphingobacteriales bacterium 44-15]
MTARDFGMGFLGRSPFDKEAGKQFREKWSTMTDSEKLEFANERFGKMGEDRFSVEKLDELCEKWTKMSAEEKQAFVDERKNAFESRRLQGLHGFWGWRH